MSNQNLPPLDLMEIEADRRQTRPLAINIEFGNAEDALNDDYLRVTSLQGEENVSQLYQFTVELKANDLNPAALNPSTVAKFNPPPKSPKFSGAINPSLAQGMGADLLGKWVQLRVAMPYDKDRFAHQPELANPAWEDNTPSRFFGGIISSVSHSSPGTYQLSVQSPLFPLTLRNRYTIHKNKSMQQLLSALLAPELLTYNSHLKLQFKLGGQTITRQQDWLQAGESDFAFLQRMLAKATIHFYFIHDKEQLTLVFSNQTTSPEEVAIPGCAAMPLQLRYSYSDIKSLGLQQDDLFCELKYEVKMVQQSSRTVLTRQQPVWETNQVAKFTSHDDSKAESGLAVEYLRHRCYAYGVDDSEAQGQEEKICQQLATEEGTLSGVSSSALLSPGYTFQLLQPVINPAGDRPEGQMPAQFNGRTFVVTKISHKVSDKESYSGTIEATEVTSGDDPCNETLITPFDMQGTQQGSVLAKVLQTAVPKDWRYRNKDNYQTEVSSTYFDEPPVTNRAIGCIVQFATDADGTSHWVALAATSQSAPEVHSMVQIGRGSNESEIPEIQQVLSSHGQKTIQPPERRSNHWTANTSWGSNYSTSFGDGISIRYGNESTVDLPQAITIVQDGYDNPGVLATNHGNSSFNQGSSFSFSVSDNDADGLSNASVSAGCNFSESHSTQNYNVSYTGASQGYSKTNKSVNVSYMGTFSETIDYASPSFSGGKIPVPSIIDICDALPDGSSYNQNHTTGQSINLSGTGVAPATTYDRSATVYSDSKTVGKVMSFSQQTGDVENTSTTTGNTTSTNTTTGTVTSTSVTNGNSTSTNSNNGDVTSTSTTTGTTTSTNTQQAVDSTSITNGKTTSHNTNNANVESHSTTNGNTDSHNTQNGDSSSNSTTTGNTSNISTTMGASSNISTTLGATSNISTTIGLSSNINAMIGGSNSMDLTIAAKNNTSIALAASFSFSMAASANMTISTVSGADISISNKNGLFVNSEVMAGVKANLYTGPAVVETVSQLAAKMKNIDAQLITLDSKL